MSMPFSAKGNEVLETAQKEALRFNHDYVGTEHVLMAFCKTPGDGGGAAMILARNIKPEEIIAAIEKMIRPSPPDPGLAIMKLPLTARTLAILDNAAEAARADGTQEIGVGHILLGILQEGESLAAQVLAGFGLRRAATA